MKEFYELKIIQAELALEGARLAENFKLFTKLEGDIKKLYSNAKGTTMKKQCSTCALANKPTKRCACNVNTKHELLDAEPMKFNGDGMQYCDQFKSRKVAK